MLSRFILLRNSDVGVLSGLEGVGLAEDSAKIAGSGLTGGVAGGTLT